MPEYTVQQGDCIASVAMRHGLHWRTLWDHGSNRGLHELRLDPNVLLPGDVLFIPERDPGEARGETEGRHRFRRKGVPARLRLRLLREGRPRAEERYVLDIDGQLFEGRTDEEGWLEQRISPDARRGRLLLEEAGEEHPLELGHLNPADDITGLQQRLSNLGLYSGGIDGEAGPRTEAALARFQESRDLEPTGQPDQATYQALRDYHRS